MGHETEVIKESGFSIVELLVVMAIVAILAAVAIPNIRSLIRFAELKRGTQSVYSVLYRARMEAIKSASNCNILFDKESRSFASVAGNTCVIPTETLPDNISFGWGSSVTKTASGGTPLPADGVAFPTNETAHFTYLGTVDAGTIYLRNELGDTMAVTISSGGRIKTRRWVGTKFLPK